jgi:tRNA nucleotidyltransferase (CCA-adding enzyme)
MYRPHPIDARIAAVVPAGSLYAVGGRVRDEVRAAIEEFEPPDSDLDYVVTGVALDELQARLGKLGRVDLVGAAFAVLKVTIKDRTVDIALPRRERSTGPKHRDFQVQSGPEIPIEEDLARRDFRMNMLARAIPAGTLVDPHGGETDIRARRVEILAPRAFEEDPLRMLRACRFAARFEYELGEAARTAMTASSAAIKTVSPERVADELTKLLVQASRPSVGLELLREGGVLAHIWPELLEGYGVDQNEWHAFDVYHHGLKTLDAAPADDVVLRFAALLHDVGKPRTKDGPHFYRHEQVGAEMAHAMLTRYRFSNDVADTTEQLVRQHMYSIDPVQSDASVRRFIRRIGPQLLARQFALRKADIAGSGLPKRDDRNEHFEERVREELTRGRAFSLADLAVRGEDVTGAMIRRGLAPAGFRGDRRVGAALAWLFEQVTDRPERNDRTALLALLDEYLDTAPRAGRA